MPQKKKIYNLSIVALAAKTNYNPNYVRWLAQTEKIPGKKIEGKWFFDWQEVASFFIVPQMIGSGNGTQQKTDATDLLS